MSIYDIGVWAREFIDANSWIGGVLLMGGVMAFAEAWHQARTRMKP